MVGVDEDLRALLTGRRREEVEVRFGEQLRREAERRRTGVAPEPVRGHAAQPRPLRAGLRPARADQQHVDGFLGLAGLGATDHAETKQRQQDFLHDTVQW